MNARKHDVSNELLDGLLANYKKPEDLIGENGLLKQLTKLLVEWALEAEMTDTSATASMKRSPTRAATPVTGIAVRP